MHKDFDSRRGFGAVGIIGVLAVLAVVGGLVFSNSSKTEEAPVTVVEEAVQDEESVEAEAERILAEKDDTEMEISEEEMADHEGATEEAESTEQSEAVTVAPEVKKEVASAGTFEAYNSSKLALANDGTVVLFFHANWCPTCRGLENDINSNLSSIPANVHLLKVDYDSETELKKKYGVVRQHTLVVVDSNGDKIKTITSPTNSLSQVVSAL